jgi:hypothetical protein
MLDQQTEEEDPKQVDQLWKQELHVYESTFKQVMELYSKKDFATID